MHQSARSRETPLVTRVTRTIPCLTFTRDGAQQGHRWLHPVHVTMSDRTALPLRHWSPE